MAAAQAALPDLAEEYLASLRAERGLSPATVTAYRHDLVVYLEHLGEAPPDPASVSGFMAAQHASGLAATTVARRLAAIRGFHRFLLTGGSYLLRPHEARRLTPASPGTSEGAHGGRDVRRAGSPRPGNSIGPP